MKVLALVKGINKKYIVTFFDLKIFIDQIQNGYIKREYRANVYRKLGLYPSFYVAKK